MSTSTDTVLEGVDLVKEFVQGDVKIRVLRSASISVRAGERIAIVGASGSGKTTLLQVLGGLDLPTSGTVEITGSAMHRLNDHTHLAARRRGLTKTPLEYIRDHLHVTTSGNFRTPTLLSAMLELGSDRILYAVDYPFETFEDACRWLDNCEISEPDRQKIGRDNARRLFGLP